jgi:hypothetical protein
MADTRLTLAGQITSKSAAIVCTQIEWPFSPSSCSIREHGVAYLHLEDLRLASQHMDCTQSVHVSLQESSCFTPCCNTFVCTIDVWHCVNPSFSAQATSTVPLDQVTRLHVI